MRVDVWSDVVCPWCYIGKRRLEAALERFPHREAVEVRYHSFQLDPSAPRGSDERVLDSLARKYRVSPAQAQEMVSRVRGLAEAEGLDFRIEGTRVENTLDAHRLLHEAQAQGRQGEAVERLFAAHFCDEERVGDPATLARLGREAGLDPAGVDATLADPTRHADAVQADLGRARAIGITGVPFFVIGERYGVSGAQSADTLLAALSRAWSEAGG